jgi:hypothetical protein
MHEFSGLIFDSLSKLLILSIFKSLQVFSLII